MKRERVKVIIKNRISFSFKLFLEKIFGCIKNKSKMVKIGIKENNKISKNIY